MEINYIFNNKLKEFYKINKILYKIINNEIYIEKLLSDKTIKKNKSSLFKIIKKPENCNNCKYFSICNFSNFDSFLINNKVMGISININKAEFKLLSNKTKSICLSNKKYGCIKSIDKFSNVILDLEEGIKQAEEKIITMKKTKNTLTKEMCKIIEGE